MCLYGLKCILRSRYPDAISWAHYKASKPDLEKANCNRVKEMTKTDLRISSLDTRITVLRIVTLETAVKTCWIRELVHRSSKNAPLVIKPGRIIKRDKLNHIKLN